MTDLKCVRRTVRPASLPIVPTATGQRSYNAPKHAVTVPVRRLSPPAIATKLSICLPRESSVLSCGYTRRLQGDRRTFRGRRGFVHRWWPAICKPRFIDRVRAVAHEHRGSSGQCVAGPGPAPRRRAECIDFVENSDLGPTRLVPACLLLALSRHQ